MNVDQRNGFPPLLSSHFAIQNGHRLLDTHCFSVCDISKALPCVC